MNTLLTRSTRLWQRGFVSIIAVLALTLVVLVILKQSVQLSASKALTSLQHSDSVAALALAQSGTEVAIQKLSAGFKSTPDLATACQPGTLGLTIENSNLGVTPGAFALVDAKASVNGYCKIRVKGTLRSASRTIETWVQLKMSYGTAGFGTNPTLQLTNPWSDAKAIGIFNLGWATQSSDGHTGLTGNVSCTDCLSTNQLWYTALTGNARDIGGAGNYSAPPMDALGSASYSHTLSDARNYVMVGHVLGGTASLAPTTLGSLGASNNNNDQGVTTSSQTSANKNWCNSDAAANAMVIGVTGKGPGITAGGLPDLSGFFNSAKFTFAGDAGPGITVLQTTLPSKSYVHYPDASVNSGLSTPIAWGDVFAEIYYYYQAPVTLSVVTGGSGSATLTVNTTYTTDSLKGRYLQPTNNKIADATYITGNTGTTVTLNQNPTGNASSLNGATICTGLCGFFPLSNNTTMSFTFGKASGTVAKSWVTGIACLKGVDDTKVQPVANPSGVKVLQWHEVLSTDTALF